MDDYVCRSHLRRKCPDAVCRQRAVRDGYVAPSTRKKVLPVEAATPALDLDLLWVATPKLGYGRDGQTRESLAHYCGAPCGHPDLATLDETGLPAGWGRIVDPKAKARLDNGERLPTTDGAELVAVGMCASCAALTP